MSIKNIDKEELVVIRPTKHKGTIYAKGEWFTVDHDEVSRPVRYGELLVRDYLIGEERCNFLKLFRQQKIYAGVQFNTSRL
tara:strand:- start:457 stop:699 length:243 start_codon:yes stop_codon:yes gene_type:complete